MIAKSKNKGIIALLLVLIIFFTPKYVISAHILEDDFEIKENQIIDAFLYEEEIKISPFWDAGGDNKMEYGNNGTHQVVSGMAFNYVRHHFPSIFDRTLEPIPTSLRQSNMPTTNTTITARRAFTIYSDWPDIPESEERGPFIGVFGIGHWSNTSHFYNPNNGLNWFRDYQRPGINARERTGFYFDRAILAYNQNNHRQAFYYLGAASHFLTDLASPPHTGDQLGPMLATLSPSNPALAGNPVMVTMALNHSHFENAIRDRVTMPLVNAHGGQSSQIPIGVNFNNDIINRFAFPNLHPFYLAREVALISYGEYDSRHENYATITRVGNEMLAMAVNANVNMLLRFMEEVGWQHNGLRILNNVVVDFAIPNNFNGSISIPNNVTIIGAHAFEDLTNLTSISIPISGNLTTIEDSAFKNTGLREFIVPARVTRIGSNAFEGTTNLTRVSFISTANLQTIGEAAFKNSGITEFDIPRNVTYIGSEAFKNTRLTNITIPSSVTYIGSAAFKNINSLRTVQFENNSRLIAINDRIFQGTRITSINIPRDVTSIGAFAFLNVHTLNSITFPADLRRIEEGAFENTGLTNITIPNRVYFIGARAFTGTLQLTTVSFAPNSQLSSINEGLFQNSNISSINMPESIRFIEAFAFAWTPNLTNIIISNKVLGIRTSAFQSSGLRSISIPESVENLGNNVFINSVHLQTVEVLRPWSSWVAITSAGANFLDNTHPNLVIGVPDASSLTAYRNAPNWNSHAHRMISRAVHVCNHVLEPFCNTYHWFICFECGDFFFERHTWHFDWESNTAICTVCGLVLQNGRSLFLELLDSDFEMPLAILKEFNELEYLIS